MSWESSPSLECGQRRRSTTVIMTSSNVSSPTAAVVSDAIRRTGSMRRRLSKQNATIEEPSLLNATKEEEEVNVPSITEMPEEAIEESSRAQRLQREDAVVGDDDTKLRPPASLMKQSWSNSKSLSRESSGTEFSDRSGINLREFISHTLHKSEEDRRVLLEFEKELVQLIEDPNVQSKKFVPVNSYHRMLLHRCAAYYGLDHNVTNSGTEVVVNKSEKTLIPEEAFKDFILHDNYREQFPGRCHRNQRVMQDPEFGGSQTSLDHDLLMMRHTQSFEAMAINQAIPPNRPVYRPMRQYSLQTQPLPQPAPQQQHQQLMSPQMAWTQQRSFEHQGFPNQFAPRFQPSLKKAESFGGMARAVSYGSRLDGPTICPTPPSVMVQPAMAVASPPILVQESVPQPYYEQQQQPQPTYVYVSNQPIMYATPVYTEMPYQQVPMAAAPQQPVIYQQEYVPQQTQYYAPPAVVDNFPVIEQFQPPQLTVPEKTETPQGYTSTHQAEVANSFIKGSIDAGYGSMNQEADSSRESEGASQPEDGAQPVVEVKQ
ncbi:unnamed protein product [Caenorhabditis bovis]|uniref:R3H domain-containing protein n=1 Tax=Caenorhabditis bovis TaxID=2654633 RepID=A0A8S1EPG8_9PELO|nr:unnamed protein product [Caenorhabditis bovis]